MNTKKRLTDRFIKSVKPPSASQTYPDEYADTVQPGLRLAVFPSGKLAWILRHKLGGHKFTIGNHPAFSLAQARDAAADALRLVAKGIDPTEDRNNRIMAERRDTVAACFAQYLDACITAGLRENTLYEKRRIITNEMLTAWGRQPVQSIRRPDVRELLRKVLKRNASAANSLRVHGGAFFSWLVDEEIIERSPFDGVDKPAKIKPRERVLTREEIALIWKAAEAVGTPFAPITQLLILTGQRRGEVTNLRWSELDLNNRLWRLPGERAKNHRPHEIPLSAEAFAIIDSLPRTGDYLFSVNNGRTPVTGFSQFKAKLDAKISELNNGAIPAWVVHDLRRSTVTHLAEMGIAPHVIEAIVNHISGHKAGIAGVYNRANYAEPKRQALAAWGAKVTALVSGKPSSNVTQLTALA